MLFLFQLALAGPIEDIRSAWTAAAEPSAVLEVDWNATNVSWPAVGTYGHKLRVHYAQTGESHYPETIVKIEVVRNTAGRIESHSYLYAPDGALRFAFAEYAETPVRVYWQGAKLLRVQVGETQHDAPTGVHLQAATMLRTESDAAFAVARGLITKPPPAFTLEELEGKLQP